MYWCQCIAYFEVCTESHILKIHVFRVTDCILSITYPGSLVKSIMMGIEHSLCQAKHTVMCIMGWTYHLTVSAMDFRGNQSRAKQCKINLQCFFVVVTLEVATFLM